ncbi:MAG: hypothetical protein J0626_02840 [Rhodospirillaceae bacterium]|nr:hypothetical protein [Rhodospirillaceae bacterium]
MASAIPIVSISGASRCCRPGGGRGIEAHARETGETLLELNVRLVLLGNIRLFEAAGFRITEQRSHPGFAVPTYHVMQKRLD